MIKNYLINNDYYYHNTHSTTHSLSDNDLIVNRPSRVYGENNLNRLHLGKYYNNHHSNNVNISNKFYVPN